MYVPSAVILHEVPGDRASLSFFVSRCYAEGAGKAAMRRHLASGSAIDTERDYTRSVALAAVRRLFSFNRIDFLKGAVMLMGLASAAVGYVRGRLAPNVGAERDLDG